MDGRASQNPRRCHRGCRGICNPHLPDGDEDDSDPWDYRRYARGGTGEFDGPARRQYDGRQYPRGRARPIEREIELKNSVSVVGPLLEPPIDEQEYQRVFAALAQEGAEGLLVNDEPENIAFRRLIVELAEKGRLPTIYSYRQFVEGGGLMAYGIDLSDLGHRIADMADQILKGAKPADIPIFRPTKFELSINLKAAKTLGIELPPLLVARADNVIE
jgi:putative ABC transport system substrate-binding protein